MIDDSLLSIGLLMLVAKLLEGLFRRGRINSIVAYTVAGILLGPLTGLVQPTVELQFVLSIGVFIFFFLIGLDEIDITSFVAVIRGRFFVAATISVLISLAVGLTVTSDILIDFGLGLDFPQAVALAGILALSSLGVVAKVLADDGRLREPLGLQIFTTVIIAELIALLVVGFTFETSGHGAFAFGSHDGFSAVGVLMLLGGIVGFTVASWLLSTRVLPHVIVFLKRVLNVPQLSFGLLLGGLFLMVVGAEKIGLHGTLGALLFGASLSRLPRQVRQDVLPGIRSTAEGLFVPLFFASAGLHLSLSFTALPLWTIVALVTVPMLGKVLGAVVGAQLTRLNISLPLATGLMAKGAAEIALLLLFFNAGIIEQDLFSLLVLIMFGYIILMPPAISYTVRRASSTATEPSAETPMPNFLPPNLLRFALDAVTVRDVMSSINHYARPMMSVRDFADRWVVPQQQDYVVVDGDELVGVVSLGKLRYLPKSEWASTPLRNVVSREPPTASLDELIEDVLQRMTEHGLTVLPIVDEDTGAFRGSVTSREILNLIIQSPTSATDMG